MWEMSNGAENPWTFSRSPHPLEPWIQSVYQNTLVHCCESRVVPPLEKVFKPSVYMTEVRFSAVLQPLSAKQRGARGDREGLRPQHPPTCPDGATRPGCDGTGDKGAATALRHCWRWSPAPSCCPLTSLLTSKLPHAQTPKVLPLPSAAIRFLARCCTGRRSPELS